MEISMIPNNGITMKVTDEQKKFLADCSHIMFEDSTPKWYYIPYWFEHVGGNTFKLHNFDNLPEELKKSIKESR
jgi:hypothetical protein